MSESVSSLLMADHRRIGALLARARQGDQRGYTLFRGALLRHIAMEEKIVFPALRATGSPLPMMDQIKRDHAALAAMLVVTPTPDLLARVATLLALHDPLEEGEGGIYGLADELLDVAEIVARLSRAPAVRVSAHFDGERAHDLIEMQLARAAQGRKGR